MLNVKTGTLLGTLVEPFRGTRKRKPVATAKFYLFDAGVANHLIKRLGVVRGSPEYGQALEHLIFLELRAYLGCRRLDHPLTFWRSQSKHEVDFLIGDEIAIEVKAAELASARAFAGLRALAEELPLRRRFLVCHEKAARITGDGIEILPREEFLRLLWQDRLV